MGAVASDLADWANDRWAGRSRCAVCRHKAARLLLRDALDAACADPSRHRRVSLMAIHEYVCERSGLECNYTSFLGHAKKHEPGRYEAWLAVRYGSG